MAEEEQQVDKNKRIRPREQACGQKCEQRGKNSIRKPVRLLDR